MNQYEATCDTCKTTLTQMTNIYIWQHSLDDDEHTICEECNQDFEADYRAEGWKEVSDD